MAKGIPKTGIYTGIINGIKTRFKKGHKINLGKHWKLSEKTKKAMSEAKKKNPVRYWLGKEREREEKNWNWKGENAGYFAIHSWLKRKFGNANKCENPSCDFKNSKRFEWASISRKSLRDRNDYVQLCPSCHRKYDENNLTL